MNARLYDAKLHRFLQPDNFVQDPLNTQNYNRYGYCWNNPLRYSDPSGDFTWSDLLAAVSIVVGVAIVIASSGTLTPLAQGFIGAGVAHFGATFAMYNNNKAAGWDAASNYAGFSSPSININTGWGDSSGSPKNGIDKVAPINEATPSSSGIATGSEMSVNFFSNSPDQMSYTDVFKYNRRYGFGNGYGVSGFDFKAYGHGNLNAFKEGFFRDYKRTGNSIYTASQFDNVMSLASPAYKSLMFMGEDPRYLELNFCMSASGTNSMAQKISAAHPNTTVVGFDGYALYGRVNGIPMIHTISTAHPSPYNNFGWRVYFHGGIEVSRILYKDFLKQKN
jgi:hypothetical protein